MAIWDSEYFVYNNIRSSDMGIVNVIIEDGSSGGMTQFYQEPFLASRTMQEIVVNHRKRPYFQRVIYTPLTLTLTFAFQNAWDDDSIREVAKWLNQDYYQELYFSSNPDRIFYAMYNGDMVLNHNGAGQGYITLTMRCDAPYSYSPVYLTPQYDLSNNPVSGTTIQFNNTGDMACSPELWITKVGNTGNITITNTSDASQPQFVFNGVQSATGQFVIYGNVTNGSTVSIGNEIYEFISNRLSTNNVSVVTSIDNVAFTLSVASGTTVSAMSSTLSYASGGNGNVTVYTDNTMSTVATGTSTVTTTMVVVGTAGDGITKTTYTIISTPSTPSTNYMVYVTSGVTPSLAVVALTSAINANSSTVTSTSDGSSTVTVTAKSIGTIGEYPVTTTLPTGAWTNTSLAGGDGLVDGETVYIDNENMDIESSLDNTYRYNAFNDNYLSLGVGSNILLVQGNCKIQFRYQFHTLQG